MDLKKAPEKVGEAPASAPMHSLRPAWSDWPFCCYRNEEVRKGLKQVCFVEFCCFRGKSNKKFSFYLKGSLLQVK